MAPRWFSEDHLPYEDMWEDDKIWLPDLLQSPSAHLNYTFWFDQNLKLARWTKSEM